MALTTVDPGLLSSAAQYTGFKNRIINGAMTIDQRNYGSVFSISGTNGSTNYIIDRFTLGIFGSGYPSGTFATTQQVVDAPTSFYNSLKISASQAVTFNTNALGSFVSQAIETNNCYDLLGTGGVGFVPMALSFWLKASITGVVSVSVETNNSPGAHYLTYVTITQANTWQYFSIPIPSVSFGTLASGNNAGLVVNIGLGNNGSWLTGSTGWNTDANRYLFVTNQTNFLATAGNTFQLTGVQLELGDQATSFDYRDIGRESILCQRYYQSFNFSNVFNGTNGQAITATKWSTTDAIVGNIPLLASMRTAPSCSSTVTTARYVNSASGTPTVSLSNISSTASGPIVLAYSDSAVSPGFGWLDAFGIVSASAEL